jgi:hypothetical protein
MRTLLFIHFCARGILLWRQGFVKSYFAENMDTAKGVLFLTERGEFAIVCGPKNSK